MKPSIREKLEQLRLRQEELDRLLASEGATRDMDSYRKLSREHAEITPVVALFADYRQAEGDLATAQQLLDDPEMKEFAVEEVAASRGAMAAAEDALQRALLP